jgi:hypothetical protein
MSARKLAAAVALVTVIATPVTALAGNGKHNPGPSPAPTAGCAYSNGVVQASGLPTGQVINFMIVTASGTTGWVLGYTSDGTWSVNVPAQTGATTYQFVSTTWGPNGSKYDVYTSCS